MEGSKLKADFEKPSRGSIPTRHKIFKSRFQA